MNREPEAQAGLVAFLAVFGMALPILAIAVWDQALNFDACANIFSRPGQCISSGLGITSGGAFLTVLGGALALSAVSACRAGRAGLLAALAIAWLGLWSGVIGAAMIVAGQSLA